MKPSWVQSPPLHKAGCGGTLLSSQNSPGKIYIFQASQGYRVRYGLTKKEAGMEPVPNVSGPGWQPPRTSKHFSFYYSIWKKQRSFLLSFPPLSSLLSLLFPLHPFPSLSLCIPKEYLPIPFLSPCLIMYPWLPWNFLHRLDWLQTHRDSLASALRAGDKGMCHHV